MTTDPRVLGQVKYWQWTSNTWTHTGNFRDAQIEREAILHPRLRNKDFRSPKPNTATINVKCLLSRAGQWTFFLLGSNFLLARVPACLSLRLMRKARGSPARTHILPARCCAEAWIWLIAFAANWFATTIMTALTHLRYRADGQTLSTAWHVETGGRGSAGQAADPVESRHIRRAGRFCWEFTQTLDSTGGHFSLLAFTPSAQELIRAIKWRKEGSTH